MLSRNIIEYIQEILIIGFKIGQLKALRTRSMSFVEDLCSNRKLDEQMRYFYSNENLSKRLNDVIVANSQPTTEQDSLPTATAHLASTDDHSTTSQSTQQ